MANKDDEHPQYEKLEYLAQVLEDSTEIIRSSSLNKKAELIKLQITEVIKLLFLTTRAGLQPHWISSNEAEEDTQEEEEESQNREFRENDLNLLD